MDALQVIAYSVRIGDCRARHVYIPAPLQRLLYIYRFSIYLPSSSAALPTFVHVNAKAKVVHLQYLYRCKDCRISRSNYANAIAHSMAIAWANPFLRSHRPSRERGTELGLSRFSAMGRKRSCVKTLQQQYHPNIRTVVPQCHR